MIIDIQKIKKCHLGQKINTVCLFLFFRMQNVTHLKALVLNMELAILLVNVLILEEQHMEPVQKDMEFVAFVSMKYFVRRHTYISTSQSK